MEEVIIKENFKQRTQMALGEENINKLSGKHVAVFGVGGVGGYVVEALVRASVGEITIIDADTVNVTNINRQIIALNSTVGMKKTDAMKARILDINPECKVNVFDMFFLPENSDQIDFTKFDYVADCIDTVTAKLEIIRKCKEAGVEIISSMGTGNKLNASLFEITDISKTSVCPLAKVMRKKCKDLGFKRVKVLYSKELPVKVGVRTPGSVSFVPSVAGLLIAGEIIRDFISK
ncbi:MAG: tRNA threonylcarbamoyladenosine dehydratase [Lachnospiraceae bacterium]|nr:tRNA threonylcarbamoyladenosine dehydratase [Lachnospiraceae bacterium]